MERLHSHIWLTASSYMGKYLRISSYIRKPFLIYDFETAPLWISFYMRKMWFSFLSVHIQLLVVFNFTLWYWQIISIRWNAKKKLVRYRHFDQ
jgi:hypothetical protein